MQVRTGSATLVSGVRRGAIEAARSVYPWSMTGAADVEDVVAWALRDQRAGSSPTRGLFRAEAEAAGLTWHGSSADGCAAVERIGAVGCRIDVSGPGRDALHPVADAVDMALDRMEEGAVVRHFGRLGERPAWRAPTRWLVPEAWVVEGLEAMWCYAERRTRPHCPLIRVCDAETMAARRAAYLAWWDELEALVWPLSGRALGFVLTGPAAAREPWLDRARQV